jgi:uncharacterized membrane protein YdjX (TVP38/TMEM64 family)
MAAILGLAFSNYPDSREFIERLLHDLNALGPLAIVLLRGATALLAVVPSSPVLLAAGATQGLFWGVLYVLIGASAGALAAFFVGRWLGRRFVERRGWVEPLVSSRYGRWLLEGDASQTRLMAAVFYCRLLPGINLDGLSYVAGATPIATWRFCIATLAGLFPYTVLLVAIGRQLVKMDAVSILIVVAALLLANGLFWAGYIRKAPRQRQDSP